MGTSELGKWAWLIALWVAILNGILAAFGVTFLSGDAITAVVLILAFLGGLLHLAGGDRTAFFIATLALVAISAVEASTGSWFGVSVIGELITGILTGVTAVAVAGAVGVLLMTVYEWAMP